MIRNSILAAALALGATGAVQAEVYIEGEANNRSIAYVGAVPTQVGGGVAHIETSGDGPEVVTDRATGAQRGPVARIVGGGDSQEVVYVEAPAPRRPRG